MSLLRFTIFLALFATGCVSVTTPEQFVVTSEASEHVRMVSSDDALYWVREFEDDFDGNLQFWADTLHKEFTDNRGYLILETKDFTDKNGRAGKEFLAEVTVDSVPHRYLCFLTVRSTFMGRVIRVAEYTAPKDVFDRHVEKVRESALAIRP